MVTQTTEDNQNETPAIVIDLGKVSRKKISQLKKGTGPLVGDVSKALELANQRLGEDASGKTLVPVVFVYSKKRKKPKMKIPFFSM